MPYKRPSERARLRQKISEFEGKLDDEFKRMGLPVRVSTESAEEKRRKHRLSNQRPRRFPFGRH